MEPLIVVTPVIRLAGRPALGGPIRLTRGALVALALLAALPGCRNPFRPSEPQPPSTDAGAIVVPTDYATPEGVLSTIVDAVFARGQGNGQSAYIGAFSDTLGDPYGYTQVFDPDVVVDRLNAGKAIPAWSRALERSFYTYLCGTQVAPDPNTEYSLGWTADAPDEIDEDAGVATLRRRYSIVALNPDNSVAQIAFGHARIIMRRLDPDSRWAITRWDDTVDATYGAAPQGDQAGYRSFSRLRIDSTEQ